MDCLATLSSDVRTELGMRAPPAVFVVLGCGRDCFLTLCDFPGLSEVCRCLAGWRGPGDSLSANGWTAGQAHESGLVGQNDGLDPVP
jgi:hypothetical protein